MSARLQEIEKLEDSINNRLTVILCSAQNSQIKNRECFFNCGEISDNLRSIEDNCKRLAKLTAKAIGMLRAYNTLMAGDADGD